MGNYFEQQPCNQLRGIVDCFWQIDVLNDSTSKSFHRVIPDNRVDILFIEQDGQLDLQFSGPMSKSFIAPSRKIFGIRFHPEYIYGLFGIQLNEFTDSSYPLEDFFKESNFLRDAYFSNNDFLDLKTVMQNYLFCKKSTLLNSCDKRVVHLVGQIEKGHSLKSTIDSAGISPQHLRRLFKKHIGISAKKYEKIRRFQSISGHLKINHPSDWSDLALQHGYFDQSHFINDCKELTGLSPQKHFY